MVGRGQYEVVATSATVAAPTTLSSAGWAARCISAQQGPPAQRHSPTTKLSSCAKPSCCFIGQTVSLGPRHAATHGARACANEAPSRLRTTGIHGACGSKAARQHTGSSSTSAYWQQGSILAAAAPAPTVFEPEHLQNHCKTNSRGMGQQRFSQGGTGRHVAHEMICRQQLPQQQQ